MNDPTLLAQPPQPRFVMCRPQYFAVTYSINPWMDPKSWADSGAVLHATAVRQWAGLHRTLLASGAAIEAIEPQPGLPDLVFTANAAVVLDRKALLARFHHPERQREQPVLTAGFRALAGARADRRDRRDARGRRARGRRRLHLGPPPRSVLDGLRLPLGCRRQRSDRASIRRALPAARARRSELLSPRHLLLRAALWRRHLFSRRIHRRRARDHPRPRRAGRSASRSTAPMPARFAANAVCLDRTVVLSRCSVALRRRLEDRGYKVAKTPLQAFQRSGGSACCLTLRLDHCDARDRCRGGLRGAGIGPAARRKPLAISNT